VNTSIVEAQSFAALSSRGRLGADVKRRNRADGCGCNMLSHHTSTLRFAEHILQTPPQGDFWNPHGRGVHARSDSRSNHLGTRNIGRPIAHSIQKLRKPRRFPVVRLACKPPVWPNRGPSGQRSSVSPNLAPEASDSSFDTMGRTHCHARMRRTQRRAISRFRRMFCTRAT
jgi:hypothetical protein